MITMVLPHVYMLVACRLGRGPVIWRIFSADMEGNLPLFEQLSGIHLEWFYLPGVQAYSQLLLLFVLVLSKF